MLLVLEGRGNLTVIIQIITLKLLIIILIYKITQLYTPHENVESPTFPLDYCYTVMFDRLMD